MILFITSQINKLIIMANLFKPKTIAMAKLAKLPKYQHPALLGQQFKKPMETQRLEIQGILPFGQGQYHNPRYEALLKSLQQSRKSYRQLTSIDSRFKIASNQISLWQNYVIQGVNTLPEEKRIDEKKKNQLYQAYIAVKERKQQKVACSRLLHFHDHYAKGFKWDIQLHPRILLQMVHPHFGYLLQWNKKVTLNQLIDLYERMLFASQERYLGQTLHANQIVAYNFWKFYTNEPHLKLGEFCEFLKGFKFQCTPETFLQQFSYNFRNNKGQLVQKAKMDQVIRFDMFRQIFLERGL